MDCLYDGLTDDVIKHIAVGLPRLRALSLRWCRRIKEKAYRYLADKALRELTLGWENRGDDDDDDDDVYDNDYDDFDNTESFRNLTNDTVLIKSIEWLDLTSFADDDSVRLLENIAIR